MSFLLAKMMDGDNSGHYDDADSDVLGRCQVFVVCTPRKALWCEVRTICTKTCKNPISMSPLQAHW